GRSVAGRAVGAVRIVALLGGRVLVAIAAGGRLAFHGPAVLAVATERIATARKHLAQLARLCVDVAVAARPDPAAGGARSRAVAGGRVEPVRAVAVLCGRVRVVVAALREMAGDAGPRGRTITGDRIHPVRDLAVLGPWVQVAVSARREVARDGSRVLSVALWRVQARSGVALLAGRSVDDAIAAAGD